MPTLETHYIGSDLEETITVTDANGTLIPDANLSKVEAIVYLNNVIMKKFQWKSAGTTDSGWTALTNESAAGTFSLKVPGAEQDNWNQGMVEVAVRRLLSAGGEETKRFQVRMAKRVAGDSFTD